MYTEQFKVHNGHLTLYTLNTGSDPAEPLGISLPTNMLSLRGSQQAPSLFMRQTLTQQIYQHLVYVCQIGVIINVEFFYQNPALSIFIFASILCTFSQKL